MRDYSLSELSRLTRGELFALYYRIAAELPALPEGERGIALEALRRIRRVLGQPRNVPS